MKQSFKAVVCMILGHLAIALTGCATSAVHKEYFEAQNKHAGQVSFAQLKGITWATGPFF